MRHFKFNDGGFKFDIYTDDKDTVAAKHTCIEDGDTFIGKAVRKHDDTFDLHLGMHIAIRKCMGKMYAEVSSVVSKMLQSLRKRFQNMKYFDRLEFTNHVEKMKVKLAKREAKKAAKKEVSK